MKLLLFFLTILLAGCASSEPQVTTSPTTVAAVTETVTMPAASTEATLPAKTVPFDPIKEMIGDMSLQERVGQLFLVRCDASVALEDIQDYHLGGFVLFGQDFENQTPDSMREKIAGYQATAKIPLLIAVDEEGGTVTRVSSNRAFRSSKFPSIRQLYETGGLDSILATEDEKCQLLKDLGINVNLGPVCDITTDPSAFMFQRSLGQDHATTADVIFSLVWKMNTYKIGSVLKHFPGYGNNTDTHTGIAVDERSLGDLEQKDLVPFQSGIESQCGAIMVSHTILTCLDAEFPASLSPSVHDYLRQEMAFDGVIITDDLVMQAITDRYGAGEAAVLAVLAGNDLLCSTDYRTQYDAVYAAVLDGRIDIDTLNNAVRNVLEWKTELGLIPLSN